VTFRAAPWPAVAFWLALALPPAVPPAAAHEYWLEPSRYRAAAGDTLAIAAFAGTGFRGERKPYAAPRTLALMLRGPRALDMRPAAVNGDLTFARFIAPDARGALIVYRSDFSPIELPATAFDRYLEDQGLEAPRAARARLGAAAGPGRERYARCAKAWIAGTRASDAPRWRTPAGLPLEIVPLAEPGRGARLPVRVLWLGRPLANAQLRAWRQPVTAAFAAIEGAMRDSAGCADQQRTDRRGQATLHVSGSGEWLVSCVHMVPSDDRAEADWQSLWASLTFARPAPPSPLASIGTRPAR
jgi:uncharacterized GH25 family protein